MQTSTTGQLPERLNPLNDYLFLKVMGEIGSETQLLGFLNAVLGRTESDKLVSVDIIENKNLPAESIGEKASVLDVRAMLEDGTRVNIEVQLRNINKNFNKRSLYYWSREYVKGIISGQDYKQLPIVITINIVNFDFLETDNFHTVFRLKEEKEPQLILTDVLKIHFINIVKWRKCAKIDIENEPLHRWLTWFDKNSPDVLVEKVVKMDKAIMAANERQIYVSEDAEIRRAYEMRELALMDERVSLSDAREEGLEEGLLRGMEKGREEGKEENRIEIARKALAEGLKPEIVQKITGLDIKIINNINCPLSAPACSN